MTGRKSAARLGAAAALDPVAGRLPGLVAGRLGRAPPRLAQALLEPGRKLVDGHPLLAQAVAITHGVRPWSSSDWWSIVTAHGVPISSWRR